MTDTAKTTHIRKAAWVVAWDAKAKSHVYLQDADVVFRGHDIVQVGGTYDGPADTVIDGSKRMVMPGLVNIHTHPTSEPLRKGITDETISPGFWHSSLYEFLTVFETDPAGAKACMQVALAELLMSGVTTVADLSVPFDGWLDTLADSGIRACIAPMFRDARWYTEDGHLLKYEWNQDNGRKAFDKAQGLIELARQHPSGRLMAMVCPSQVDTCTPELIRDAHDLAKAKNLPFQIHASQSVVEFHEITRRTGLTPIQWLHSIGALDDHSIIGHCIFIDEHPWLHWTTKTDLSILKETGTTVAHCPTVFVRRGITLRSFGDYRTRGINVGIGTDTFPHNFLEEMRNAMHFSRITDGTVPTAMTADVFEAATLSGAKALRRDDIGRLAPGAKADMVLVDVEAPSMRPLRDPLRSLIHVAAERAVRDVYVDGELVVKDGKCLTIDLEAASAALEEAQGRSLKGVPKHDWKKRSADELAPMALRIADRV